ncbi:MAG: LapA family protein [SAR324 cluster bacterium]|nr:LapA family protein [SAR324 cluster bacterium]|tara:strand:- start:233 stop:652 length:420 start_codon:yes stop_codon:yes gene_type:complete
MRYLSLIIFAGFLVFCVDFATQNTETVVINYQLDWLKFSFRSERPVFVPIFFTFAFGIIFCVIYFFIYHSVLLGKLHRQKKEIKRLNKLVESHKEPDVVTDERKSELNQIVASVHDSVDEQDDLEPPDLHKEEDLKTSA